MDVRLSPEQQAIRDSVAQVVNRLGPHTVGQLDDLERAEKLDAAVGASGWRELRTPDNRGAPLASGVEAALVAEELARGLADAAFVGPTLAAELRRLACAPRANSRETVGLDSDLAAPAEAVNGAVAIDAAGAAKALLLAPAGDEYRLLKATLDPGRQRVDLTRPSALVAASGHAVVIGSVTADDVARWTALGLALTCADLVGAMRGAVELACGYARERRQYGVPIGSFQAIQHLLADALVATEGSSSVALHAAWAVDALPSAEALAAAAVAKAYCSRSAVAVCETAIQVHGGIGNTWECLAHLFLRRAVLSTDILGGVGASLARVLAAHGIGGHDGLR